MAFGLYIEVFLPGRLFVREQLGVAMTGSLPAELWGRLT